MLTRKLRTSFNRIPYLCAGTVFLLALVTLAQAASDSRNGEPLYPQALMNWMVEGTFHALVVDKSQQRLTVWRVKDGEPSEVESYRCATGENEGDKWVRGDMKTPEGVYLFCSVIDGRRLPAKYGLWAFTTDYPNFVDRRRGKSGDGIWLHGRDKPLRERPDSNGCIALENQDLLKVSRFIRLQGTPLIVVDRVRMAPRSAILEQERQLRDFVESWRESWESRDVDGYMNHYSPNFQACWLDFKCWKEKKRRLSRRYKNIKVRLSDVYLYRQDGLVTAVFKQWYNSDGFRSTGVKVLYITHQGGKYAIYSEDYHQPVDDEFPVRTLLARAGAEPQIGADKSNEFRIRLVSTDEPDSYQDGEIERPRPSAPSRGVVLDRLDSNSSRDIEPPTVETVGRLAEEYTPERLIVARMVPAYAPADLAPAVRTRQNLVAPAKEPREEEPSRSQDDSREKSSGPTREGPGQTVAGPRLVESGPPVEETAPRPETQVAKSQPIKKTNKKGIRQEIAQFVDQWKDAWEQKDLDRFGKMYHPNFRQGKMSYDDFLKSKRQFFHKYQNIRVEVERVETRKVKGQLVVTFLQTFRGDDYSDKGRKSMVLAQGEGEGYRILEENWSSLGGSPADSRTKSP